MMRPLLILMMAWAGLLTVGCGKRSDTPKVGAPEKAAKQGEKSEKNEDEHDHSHGQGSGGEEHVTVSVQQQQANRFELAEAQERSVSRRIETTGTVGLNEARIARLRPLARGHILSVNVRPGDAVRKGQELLTYDNIEVGEVVGELLQTQARIDKARAEAAVAKKAIERARNLVDLGGIARTELERREVEGQSADAAIQAEAAKQRVWREKLLRFGLTSSEVDSLLNGRGGTPTSRELARVRLTAPFDGIVTKLSSAEGESIQPDTQLMELADTSTVWVQADVFERDLSSVRVGQTAIVRLEAYPDEAFQGKVTYIGDSVDRETRTTRIRCEVLNPNRRLKLDMYATVQLPGKGTQSVLMVPQGAVQQLEGKQAVFVREKEQEFAIRPVKTGASVEGWVEINEGLKPRETVVVRGSFVLRAEHLKAEMGEAGHSHD